MNHAVVARHALVITQPKAMYGFLRRPKRGQLSEIKANTILRDHAMSMIACCDELTYEGTFK